MERHWKDSNNKLNSCKTQNEELDAGFRSLQMDLLIGFPTYSQWISVDSSQSKSNMNKLLFWGIRGYTSKGNKGSWSILHHSWWNAPFPFWKGFNLHQTTKKFWVSQAPCGAASPTISANSAIASQTSRGFFQHPTVRSDPPHVMKKWFLTGKKKWCLRKLTLANFNS